MDEYIESGKEYLYYVRRKIESLTEKELQKIDIFDDMAASLYFVGSPGTDERVQTSSSGDKIGEAIGRVMSTEQRINGYRRNIDMVREDAINQILKIKNEPLSSVLIDKFILSKSNVEIASCEHMTKRGVIKRVNRALTEFEKVYEKQKKI